MLEFIVSFNDNPNPPKGNGATPIDSAAFEGNIEMVKFLASKVENLNITRNNGATPIYIASEKGHIDIVRPEISQDDIYESLKLLELEMPLSICL